MSVQFKKEAMKRADTRRPRSAKSLARNLPSPNASSRNESASTVTSVLWSLVLCFFVLGLSVMAAREFRIRDAQVGSDRRLALTFQADPAFYYILFEGEAVTNIVLATDIVLATGADGVLVGRPLAATNSAVFYRVAQIPIGQPQDTDGDGLDDVEELRQKPGRNPLDARDGGRLTTLTSSPASGERDVSPTRETILHFSQALATNTQPTLDDFHAEFGGRRLLGRIELSGDRQRMTLFHLEPLNASTNKGVPNASRIRVTFDARNTRDSLGRLVDADGDGVPGGIVVIDFDTAGQSPLAGTLVYGRVFASEFLVRQVGNSNVPVNVPLKGVAVTADGFEESVRAITDEHGSFRLTNAPGGPFFVHVDGRTASVSHYPNGEYYPFVGKLWTSIPGGEVNIGDVFLPRIEAGALRAVSPTESTLITLSSNVVGQRPEFAELSLTVPPNSLYKDDGTRGGRVGVAPVRPDRLPQALPSGLNFAMVVTVQTDGALNFDQPVPICFPNLPDPQTGLVKPPGSKQTLWSFDHDLGNWVPRGTMTVSEDGKRVCSDPGSGIMSPGWHAPCDCSPFGPPSENPPRGGGSPPNCPPLPTSGASGTASGENQNSCVACESTGGSNPVLLFSGEKWQTTEDLRIKGVGIDFVWTRTYRSQSGPNTAQGNGWDFNYNLRLVPSGSGVRFLSGGTRDDLLLRSRDGSYTKLGSRFSVRTDSPDGATLSFPDRSGYRFHPFDGSPRAGAVAAIIDRHGNTMRFDYDDRGRLVTIIDTLDRPIHVAYNDQGLIESVTDFTGRRVRYQYFGEGDPGGNPGDLKSVTSPAVLGTPNDNDFPNGKTVSYTYSTGHSDDRLNHNLLTITDGRRNDPKDSTYGQGPYLINIYSTVTDPNDLQFDRVVRQIRGGAVYDFTYVPQPPEQFGGLGYMKTILRDGVGVVTEYYHDAGNRLRLVREFTGFSKTNEPVTDLSNRPTGRLRPQDPEYFQTRHDYNADFQIVQTVHPGGNITRRVYESDINPVAPAHARNNLREIRKLRGTHPVAGDQDEIIEKFEYESSFGACSSCGFNFVTRHVDPRGHEVLSQYDASGNLTLRTNRIADVVDRWTYNARGQMETRLVSRICG